MAQSPAIICGFCETASASLYCAECDQDLCVRCRQNVHDKVPSLRDHKVVEGNRVFRPRPVCETHKNTFAYYCNKCDCLTCAECMTSTHNEHKTEKIRTVADKCRQKVNQIKDKLGTQFGVVKQKLETIDTEHSFQLKSDFECYVAKVQETVDELHKIIDRYKQISLTTALDFKEIESQDLDRKKMFFRRLQDEIKDRYLKFENLLQESHDSTFLTEWKALQTEVQSINEETEDALSSPGRIPLFNQNHFTDSVIEEIDANFHKKEQEEKNQMQNHIRKLQKELDRERNRRKTAEEIDQKQAASFKMNTLEYEKLKFFFAEHSILKGQCEYMYEYGVLFRVIGSTREEPKLMAEFESDMCYIKSLASLEICSRENITNDKLVEIRKDLSETKEIYCSLSKDKHILSLFGTSYQLLQEGKFKAEMALGLNALRKTRLDRVIQK